MPREKLETEVVRAVGEAGRARAPSAAAARRRRHRVQPGEELQVLARGQLRIEEEIVTEHANRGAQGWPVFACHRGVRSRIVPARWTQQRGEQRQHVDLPAPLGPSRPRMVPRVDVEGDARERAAAAEVAGDVFDRQVVEISPGESRGLVPSGVERPSGRSRGAHAATSSPPPCGFRSARPARRRSVRAPRAAAGAARPPATDRARRRSFERRQLPEQLVAPQHEPAARVVALGPPREREPRARRR